MSEFTDAEIERYSRQMILPEIGGAGQEKLARASVLLVGAGGLGSSCALYLAAAGVGRIGIVDSDQVELNNLQRQIIHSTNSLGQPKATSAQATIHALNPHVSVEPHPERLTTQNAADYISRYNFVIEGSDNFETKLLVNDTCLMLGKPCTIGGSIQYRGQILTVAPGKGACYRCIFPEPPAATTMPTCQEAGVLGTVPGIIGTLEATEALKYFLEVGELLIGRLLTYDAKITRFKLLSVAPDLNCPACCKRATFTQDALAIGQCSS